MTTDLIHRLYEFRDDLVGVMAFLDECEDKGIVIEGIDVIPEHWRTRNVIVFLLYTAGECQRKGVEVRFQDRSPSVTLVVWLASKSSEYCLWQQYPGIAMNLALAKLKVWKAILEVATRETPGIIYDPPQAFIG